MKTKKVIDLEQVEDMASEFCTQEEIADDMGFERTLFYRRKDVAAAFSRGKNSAKMSLRHMMYNAAKGGDKTVMIFLAKNELGYRDNPEPVQSQAKEGRGAVDDETRQKVEDIISEFESVEENKSDG